MDHFTKTLGRRAASAKDTTVPNRVLNGRILNGRVLNGACVALLLGAAAFVTGCGPSVGGYCATARDCEGGNDADEEACNIRFEELRELGDLQNCSEEFDVWFECVAEESRCNDDRYVTDDDACGSEEEQFERCADVGGL